MAEVLLFHHVQAPSMNERTRSRPACPSSVDLVYGDWSAIGIGAEHAPPRQ